MWVLEIDYRESSLISLIQSIIKELPDNKKQLYILETPNLLIGDIIIKKDGVIKLIIERKSLSDLYSSIRDGRYKEQSYRLNEYDLPNHNIIYLLEGCYDDTKTSANYNYKNNQKYKKQTYVSKIKSKNIETNNCLIGCDSDDDDIIIKEKSTSNNNNNNNNNNDMYNIPSQILYSTIFSLNVVKGFSVHRTLSLQDTANYITSFMNKMVKEEEIFYNDNKNNIEKNDDYVKQLQVKTKKSYITPDNIHIIMLTQIPGISNYTAIALLKEVGSWQQLVKIAKNEDDIKLNAIYLPMEKTLDKKKKLSKNICENLELFLKEM